MKKALPIALTLACLFSGQAFAAAGDNGIHLGIKTGVMDVDVAGFDIDTPLGIVFGFEQGSYGVEAELTFADGELELFGFGSASFDFDTLAIYGVFRSQGEVFYKLKAGFLREDIDGATDSGLSVGVGFGARIDSVSLEAEYTIIEEDVSFLSVGGNIHF